MRPPPEQHLGAVKVTFDQQPTTVSFDLAVALLRRGGERVEAGMVVDRRP